MKPRRALAFAALLAALPLAPVAAPARADENAGKATDALLARLDHASHEVRTLAGRFEQKSRLKLFKQELTSTGLFYFQRPSRLRWEYLAPDASTLILDGNQATLRMPGAAPKRFDLAHDATLRAVFDQIFLWLGSGSLARARADYAIAAAGPPDAPTLVLTPLPASTVNKAFARIELHFDKTLLLRRILLREPSGDEKEIRFSTLTRNAKLPPDAFK